MTKKSIIGYGYIPRNVQAVCLKTKNNATLGEVEYKIISEIYERKFEPEGVYAVIIKSKSTARATVNVLDTNTGLTYAVEYEPANLVRKPIEYNWKDVKVHLPKGMRLVPINEVPDEKTFVERVQELAEELEEYVKEGGDYAKNRGIVFFAIENDPKKETSLGTAFVGGGGKNIVRSITASCLENPQVLKLLQAATARAIFERMAKGNKE